MGLTIALTGDGLRRLEEALSAVSDDRAQRAYARGINHTGGVAKTATSRALAAQTGLKVRVVRKALDRSVKRATPGNLIFVIEGSGGDIRLKFFDPRETRKGVSARPWNHRQAFADTFMKGGFFPNRVPIGLGGQVFKRVGAKRLPIKNVKSGLFIPIEMVQSASAVAFLAQAGRLQPRIEHEIRRLTKGVIS